MAVFPVVADANVLFGILSTDFLIRTSGLGLFRLHWTETILDEARRNIIEKRQGIDPSALDERFAAMKSALPEAMVEPPPELIAAMTNDPGDRHVLAAAVHAGAHTIVTENTKDFPAAACEPYGVEAQSLDDFASHLVSLNQGLVVEALAAMADTRSHPPNRLGQIVEAISAQMPATAAQLRDIAGTVE